MNVSVGYVKQGKRVLIIDADTAQKTTEKWPRQPKRDVINVISCPINEIIPTLAKMIGDYDVVLIDCPGRDAPAIGNVIQLVDLLISPTKPTHLDMPELERLIRVSRAKLVPHVVVFNEGSRETTLEIEQLRHQYAGVGPFTPTAMRHFQQYRRAYARGLGVLNLRGEHPAKANFQRVFAELSAAINNAHREWVSAQ